MGKRQKINVTTTRRHSTNKNHVYLPCESEPKAKMMKFLNDSGG